MAQRKQTDNDRVMDVFMTEHPQDVPWSPTIWRQQLGILKKALINQGYDHDTVIDAIRYCKLKGKHLHSLAYVPYIIEKSKLYWEQRRKQEVEQAKLLESIQSKSVEHKTVQRENNGPAWLNENGFEDV